MTKGKRARSAIAVAVVVVAAIAAHRISPSQAPELLGRFIGSLHGPGFAAIAVFLYWLLGERRHGWLRYLAAAGGAGFIGLISEIAQIPGPRDAQYIDLLVDGIGIFGALGLVASFDKRLRSHTHRFVQLLLPVASGIALAITFVPTLWYAYAFVQQTRAVPELLTFEHRWEAATFSQPGEQQPAVIPAPKNWPMSDSAVAQASESGKHGIFLSLHPAQDWRDYSGLSFIAAGQDPFALAVGIRDQRPGRGTKSNRHYERLALSATPQRFYIPFDNIRRDDEGRPFDFAHVEAVTFSAAKPGGDAVLFIDDVRLEP